MKCSLANEPGAAWGQKEESKMRFLIAWALGVPGIVIVIWFLMSHH